MAQSLTEDIEIGMKIKCFIDAGLQNQISRESLETILGEMASTQNGSKEVIRVLLDFLYSKHENVSTPEQQSKNETIPQRQEKHTEDINLDDIEVTDDAIDYIEILDETENMLGEPIKVEDESLKETSLDQLDDDISSFETNNINEEVLDDDEYYELATSSIDTKSKRERLECHVCEKTFKYRIEHNKHMKIHDANEAISENAEMTNEGKENDIHEELDKVTEDSKRIHNCEKPYECKTCRRRFKQSAHLKKHELIHTGEKPYECKTCKKRFNINGSLDTHMRIHTGEVPYECKTCKRRFNTTGSLKTHERKHTGELPFVCKTCSKRFNDQGHLIRHERIHTGEKPYECKTCKKRFRQSNHLKTHEMIHTGEKPYECKLCKKRFSERSGLKRHEMIHTGLKTFQCQ